MVLLILSIIVLMTINLNDVQYCGYYYSYPIEREDNTT